MANQLMNPQGFTGKGPAKAFGQADMSESLSDGIGSSYGVIHYKGGKWSIRYRGEDKFFKLSGGGLAPHLDVIILQQARAKSKSYFPQWEEGTKSRPICSSLNGVVPDEGVAAKQSSTCALCPRDTWKTGANGKRTKECQDYKRLAVLLMPSQTKLIFEEPVVEPVFLRVPPASLSALAALGDDMRNQGYQYYTYVTRITFVETESYPKMVFTAHQEIPDNEAPVVMAMRNNPLCARIIGDVDAAPAAGETASSPFTVTAPVTGLNGGGPVIEITPLKDGPAIEVTQEFVGKPAPEVSDTGEPASSDAQLDALIAARLNAMMPTK